VPKLAIEVESPSDSGPTDAEVARFVNTVTMKDQVQESLNTLLVYDSSTLLPTGSQAGNDRDTEAQQTTTAPSEDKLSLVTWKDYIQVVVTLALLLASFAISPALETIGADPLGFSRLA
jgi:hypothetical protein